MRPSPCAPRPRSATRSAWMWTAARCGRDRHDHPRGRLGAGRAGPGPVAAIAQLAEAGSDRDRGRWQSPRAAQHGALRPARCARRGRAGTDLRCGLRVVRAAPGGWGRGHDGRRGGCGGLRGTALPIGAHDLVIGLAASGRTPFVVGALENGRADRDDSVATSICADSPPLPSSTPAPVIGSPDEGRECAEDRARHVLDGGHGAARSHLLQPHDRCRTHQREAARTLRPQCSSRRPGLRRRSARGCSPRRGTSARP